MSLVVPKADDSQHVHSFAAALQQLAARNGELTPPLEAFLTSNAGNLARCAKPFKAPNAASRSKVDGGKFTSETGENIELRTREREIVKQIADKLQIDEIQAATLLRSYRKDLAEDIAEDAQAALSNSDDFWARITAFVLEEQLRIIQIVALLLRTADFELRVPPHVVQRFASDVTTPQFAQGLLDTVRELATAPIPASAVPFSAIWAKFRIQQQKALLEVYFLLYYNRLFPNGKSLLSVLRHVKDTAWGMSQVSEALFDTEAQAFAQDVVALSHLVLLESLNLERAASPRAEELTLVPGQEPGEDELLHPATLQRVHSSIIQLIESNPRQSALLALSWAFVLFRITESISSVPLPESYYDIAQQILPVDLHPRKNSKVANANNGTQALWQLLVTHAINPNVACLSLLHEVLNTPLVLASGTSSSSLQPSSDPNVAGYLSVLRSVLASLPQLIHPSYLPPSDFSSLVAVFEAMYSNPDAGLLRGNFWGLFEDADDSPIREEEWQIVDLAARRFPAEVGPLVRMLRAVSGGRPQSLLNSPYIDVEPENEAAVIAKRCVMRTLQYLAQPQSLTQALPATSPVMPLPYEAAKGLHAGPTDIVAVRPIHISPSLAIPAGTAGRIVSPSDLRPLIVAWNVARTNTPLSIFRLFGDYLQLFVKQGSKRSTAAATSADVFQGSGDEAIPDVFYHVTVTQLADLTNMLAIMRDIVSQVPRKAQAIMNATFGDTSMGLRILTGIIEQASILEGGGSLFVVAVNLLTALLASNASDVWSYLRGSDIIFPLDVTSALPVWGARRGNTRKTVLVEDKVKGTYGRTIACLELVQALVLQAQWSLESDNAAASKAKEAVLGRAFQWALSSLWTSYTAWRYHDIRERFQIGSRLASILAEIAHEARFGAKGSLASTVKLVTQAFILKPTHAHLAALLGTINTGNRSLEALYLQGKATDSALAEDCVEKHLHLTNGLLRICRQVKPDTISLLERLLFAHSSENLLQTILPDSSVDSIYVLTEYVVASGSPRIATEAATVLSNLCILGAAWGSPAERPSLLIHLGSIRETDMLVKKLLSLAGDPFVDPEVQMATWTFFTAIAESQPGFASILITGHQALAHPQDGHPSPSEKKTPTATSLALQVLQGWEEAWLVQPALLAAALAFLAKLWESHMDTSEHLQECRGDSTMWKSLLHIVQRSPEGSTLTSLNDGEHRSNEDSLTYQCQRAAQDYAAQLFALDADLPTNANTSKPASRTTSGEVLMASLEDTSKLKTCLDNARHYTFEDEFAHDSSKRLADAFPGFILDTFVRPQLLCQQACGSSVRYDLDIVHKRLLGHVAQAGLDRNILNNALERVEQLNTMWARAKANAGYLKSLLNCCQTLLRQEPLTNSAAIAIQIAMKDLLQDRLSLPLATPLAECYYTDILLLVRALAECLARTEAATTSDYKLSLLAYAAAALKHDTFTLALALEGSGHVYYVTVLQITYAAFRLSSSLSSKSVSRRGLESKAIESTEACISASLEAFNDTLVAARESSEHAMLSRHAVWAGAVISEILASPLAPSSARWLAVCMNVELFRHSLDLLSAVPLSGYSLLLVHASLELLLVLAKDAQAAERMALDGAIFALCNNSLTAILEEGSLVPETSQDDSDAAIPSRHDIWLLFLSLVTQLTRHLGSRITFMDQDVTTFVQMYRPQMIKSLGWTPNAALTTSVIKEHRALLSLLSTCIRCSGQVEYARVALQKLLQPVLLLLPRLVYMLQHPNLLGSLIEPLSMNERLWLSSETDQSDTVDLSDFHNHPVVASLCQEFLSLSWMIVSIFVSHTEAFTVLTRDRVDWPKDKVVIAATANVSLDEPASLGTFFDIARFCMDVVRHCKKDPVIMAPAGPLPTYKPDTIREIAEQCYEGTLLLMSTQIALTVQQQDISGANDRASQRARRDLKELASDLVEEFLDRTSSQPTNEKKLNDILKTFVLRL